MERLADFYHSRARYKEEEGLRRHLLTELKAENVNGNNYNYQIREQLQQLASCLSHLGREAESKVLLEEAHRIKT